MDYMTYEAGGFAFQNEETMQKAVKEAEGVRYVKSRTDMGKPQTVYQVYCQMVGQKMFQTPVGYVYLHDLQEYLKANPSIANKEIPPIPVAIDAVSAVQKANKAEKEWYTKTKTKTIRKTKVIHADYKKWFRASMTVSIILFFIVVGMFAVTATSGNINIVNYENALIEKYENWDMQLKEK